MRRRVAFAVTTAATVLLWGFFLQHGQFDTRGYDWPKEHWYLDVWRLALATRTVPWHTAGGYQSTHRFLANPEVPVVPQLLLLTRMSRHRYMLMNHTLYVLIGCVGLALIARRFRLRTSVALALHALFMFNGYIVAHIAAGHTMWVGYFLLPWFALFVFDARRPSRARRMRVSLGLSLVLLALFASGSVHMAVWCVWFVALCVLLGAVPLRPAALAILLGCALAAYRIVPALVGFGSASPFIASYPTVGSILDAFVTLPTGTVPGTFWWEYTFFIGAPAAVVVAWFGLMRSARSAGPLTLAGSIFACLILWKNSLVLNNPLTGAVFPERVAMRLLIVPVVLLLITAARSASASLRRKARPMRVFLAVSFAWTVVLLWLFAAETTNGMAPHELFPPATAEITTESDPLYRAAFIAGAVISCAAAVVTVSLMRLARRPATI